MTVLLFILRQFIICTYHFNHLIMYVVLCFIFVIFLQVQLYKLESISQYFENFCLMTEFQTNQFIRQSVHKKCKFRCSLDQFAC